MGVVLNHKLYTITAKAATVQCIIGNSSTSKQQAAKTKTSSTV
jgi:hypothetical protein